MIPQNDRRLVCLHYLPSDCSVVRSAQAAGWQLHNIRDLASARGDIKDNDIRVGLVLLSGAEPEDWLRQVEGLLSHSTGTEWVAIVSAELLENPRVCDLVAAYCLDFHTLPVDTDRFLHSLGHAHGMASLLPIARFAIRDECIIGNSESTRTLINELDKVARVDAPLLITGETGTGKELSAREIHFRSVRHEGPFVAVNCAELPPTLIHAELFGYDKGAFTGAASRKIGYLEQAGGGTIFLDEIGDLPIDLQMLLLRFLEQKSIRRVGGVNDIPVDARVIAATHVNLPVAVQEGRFREDLFHRLNVLHIHTPALRERKGDIEQLARHFLEKFSGESRMNVQGFNRSTLDAMHRYNWPGNIRELMNRVRRALVMCSGRLITAADLGIDDVTPARDLPPLQSLEEARAEAEQAAIAAALEHADGHANQAAELLEISRASLYRLLEKHSLSIADWAANPANDSGSDPRGSVSGSSGDDETELSTEPSQTHRLRH
jgi:DNA-binding NtrC family response regulator